MDDERRTVWSRTYHVAVWTPDGYIATQDVTIDPMIPEKDDPRYVAQAAAENCALVQRKQERRLVAG